MTLVYIALGSNLGNPVTMVTTAIKALSSLPHARLVATSSLYRTAPIGLKNQPDFINAVVALNVKLEPHPLLDCLFEIEARFGRQRSIPNAPRTLDLDLLMYGTMHLNTDALTLPHPRMHQRAFVLTPLLEIAPDCDIPGIGSARKQLDACRDQIISPIELTH